MQRVNLHDNLLLAYSEVVDGNMDVKFGAAAEVKKHRQDFFKSTGLSSLQIIEGEQIHFSRLLVLNKDNAKMWHGQKVTGVDGFLTNESSVAILLRVADCLPVCLFDPEHHAVALVHAGWRGVVARIHELALERLQSMYKTEPKSCMLWVGPSARSCCYNHETLPESLQATEWKPYRHKQKGRIYVDTVGFVVDALHTAGVLKKNMMIDPRCTIEDTNLFSHQRSVSTGEPEGRFVVVAKVHK